MMSIISLITFCLAFANNPFVTCQYASQVYQQQISNGPVENIVYSSNFIPNRPIEVVENIVYPSPNIISNRPVEVIDNVFYSPPVIGEPICNGILPQSSGNTILITDCSPSACQNLADTLQLMIVCNMLQNTQGGKDYALQLAGPIINQLVSSPVLSCGCPNPIFSNTAPVCPNVLPNIFTPSVSEVVSPVPTTPVWEMINGNLVSNAPVSSCSCQSTGVVSTCPCQACASPCSCQTLSGPVLYSCQKCLAPVSASSCQKCAGSCPCQACSSAAPVVCQKCSSAPSCPCQSCSAAVPVAPTPPPAQSCSCQACTACPNSLNSIISSFLNFL